MRNRDVHIWWTTGPTLTLCSCQIGRNQTGSYGACAVSKRSKLVLTPPKHDYDVGFGFSKVILLLWYHTNTIVPLRMRTAWIFLEVKASVYIRQTEGPASLLQLRRTSMEENRFGQQRLMFIFIYLYNVYQTKTVTASNLKQIKKKKKKQNLKTQQSVGLWIRRRSNQQEWRYEGMGAADVWTVCSPGGRRRTEGFFWGGGSKVATAGGEWDGQVTPLLADDFYGLAHPWSKEKQRVSGFGTTEGRVLLFTDALLQLADCVCVVNGVDACPVVDCVRGTEGGGMFGVRVRLCACGTDAAPLCNTCTPGIHVSQPGGEHWCLLALVCHWMCMLCACVRVCLSGPTWGPCLVTSVCPASLWISQSVWSNISSYSLASRNRVSCGNSLASSRVDPGSNWVIWGRQTHNHWSTRADNLSMKNKIIYI